MLTLEQLNDNRSINNRFGQLLGIRITALGEGFAKSELTVREDFFNPNFTVHGGVIFTLLDATTGAACASYGISCTTMDASVNFLKAPIHSKILYGEAKEIKRGKTISVYDGVVTDDTGALISKGTFTFYSLQKAFPMKAADETKKEEPSGKQTIPGVTPGPYLA